MAKTRRKTMRWILDLLGFRRMVCPVLVQWVVFPFWVAFSLLPAFALAGLCARLLSTHMGNHSLGTATGLLVFGIVWPALIVCGRICLELVLVLFKIHERLEETALLLREIDGGAEDDEL
ncbi:MAG: DUF4282 domain-containing protein [Lentisphaeria bacterium]|nr:DUF4282 domain-containing protein [Lentisphaeria bacterium]